MLAHPTLDQLRALGLHGMAKAFVDAGDHPDAAALAERYPKAQSRDFDGNPRRISEADALIAYLQMLGTQVDFRLYDDKANIR
jgi:cbb3-type cytochrome oxidase cytochrome c subunit